VKVLLNIENIARFTQIATNILNVCHCKSNRLS